MSAYRANNGRLIPRRSNGRFRKVTLQDFGIAKTEIAVSDHECRECGRIWRPFLLTGECPQCGAQNSLPHETNPGGSGPHRQEKEDGP